ncbi:MAG TPA: sulfotransferase, partial [Euzebyales bacterium]|nr:sulfotransferase [Euzebyales bacterium]
MSAGPVFIGGLAFSGKTPLRIALSAHPRLVLTRHTALWVRYHGRFGDLGRPRNLDRCLSAMASDPRLAGLAPDRPRIEREFRTGPGTHAHLFELVHRHHAERLGKQRWGDQMGMFERHADRVLTAYADAQMIHMVRDPRTWHAAAITTRRRRLGRLGWETARWRASADLATRNLRRYRGRYHVVRYEALCGDPEATLREVLAFLVEDYDPSVLSGVTLDEPQRRAALAPAEQRRAAAFI